MTGCGSPICVIAPRESADPDAQVTIWPCRCGESALRLAVGELRARVQTLERQRTALTLREESEARKRCKLEQRLAAVRAACEDD